MQQWAGLWIEAVQLVLSKIADRQVLTGFQLAGEQWQGTGQCLDQGRFACAVRTENTDARAGCQLQFDVLQNGRAVVAEYPFAQVQQRVGLVVRLAEAEVEWRV